jgi:hypothetical protein
MSGEQSRRFRKAWTKGLLECSITPIRGKHALDAGICGYEPPDD